MTPEHWQQIDELFHRALERGPAERAAFLAEACAGDEALSREVASLLAAHEQAGSFYDAAPAELATKLLEGGQSPSLAGQPLGQAFRVTELESPGRMVSLLAGSNDFALATDRLIVPITEVSGGLWILENLRAEH